MDRLQLVGVVTVTAIIVGRNSEKKYGVEIPLEADWSDPNWRKFILWRIQIHPKLV